MKKKHIKQELLARCGIKTKVELNEVTDVTCIRYPVGLSHKDALAIIAEGLGQVAYAGIDYKVSIDDLDNVLIEKL